MLAFRGLERDKNGSFTEECELGALMENEYQAAVVNIDRNITLYFEGLAKAANKPPHG